MELLNLPEHVAAFYRSKHGWHIVVMTYEYLSKGEILLAQAIICGMIGGDLKREAMNFRRARNKVFLNVLFEPEEKQ